MNMARFCLVLVVGLVMSAVLTSVEIPFLKKKQFKQYIREEGPESHQKKSGTPTMGGIAMIASQALVMLILGDSGFETLMMICMMLMFGAIGFFDDFIKVAKKHNLGLRAWQKIVLQVAFAAVLAVYISNFSDYGTKVFIPFIGEYIEFGVMYIPFVILVVVAMANSVNLTDGLDGLCSGVTAIVSVLFAIIAFKMGQNPPFVFCAALSGVCLGFLIFNRHPAKLFMGDTGSMALGGGLAAAAIMLKMEFLLVIAGFVYVFESLSVIIQVASFKTRGKRVFKMAPIHHHFEMSGMSEQSVVHMFWIISAVCSIIAYFVYKI